VESAVGLGGWKYMTETITVNSDNEGLYIYTTGSEPLVLGSVDMG